MSAHLWPNTQADYVHQISECTSAACNQGRRQCPCPEACHQPDDGDADGFGAVRGIGIAVGITALAAAFALALAGFFLPNH